MISSQREPGDAAAGHHAEHRRPQENLRHKRQEPHQRAEHEIAAVNEAFFQRDSQDGPPRAGRSGKRPQRPTVSVGSGGVRRRDGGGHARRFERLLSATANCRQLSSDSGSGKPHKPAPPHPSPLPEEREKCLLLTRFRRAADPVPRSFYRRSCTCRRRLTRGWNSRDPNGCREFRSACRPFVRRGKAATRRSC